MPDTTQPSRRGRRGNPAARRQAILQAALVRFLAEGFAATTLEDIARQAGVAKGTIYLYFADKEALFRGLVQELLTPVIAGAEALLAGFQGSARQFLTQVARRFVRQVLLTERRQLMRLVITEAPRFPWLAEVWWQEVVRRGMALIRAAGRHGVAQGEFASDALERFPQLVAAPLLLGFLWLTLFERFEPLEVERFVETHLELLFRGLQEAKP